MKLRNKRTGEIIETGRNFLSMPNGQVHSSLAEMANEWEDYQDQKEYWYIDSYEGTVIEKTEEFFKLTDKERKEIGNYFKTEKQAKRAVRKMKALQRLKDKGFRFEGYIWGENDELRIRASFGGGDNVADENWESVQKDLKTLFGRR